MLHGQGQMGNSFAASPPVRMQCGCIPAIFSQMCMLPLNRATQCRHDAALYGICRATRKRLPVCPSPRPLVPSLLQAPLASWQLRARSARPETRPPPTRHPPSSLFQPTRPMLASGCAGVPLSNPSSDPPPVAAGSHSYCLHPEICASVDQPVGIIAKGAQQLN